jgi:hypothetical protein
MNIAELMIIKTNRWSRSNDDIVLYGAYYKLESSVSRHIIVTAV